MTNVKMLENPIEAICLLIENAVEAGAKRCSIQMQYLQSAEKLANFSDAALVSHPTPQQQQQRSIGNGSQKCLSF